MHQRIQGALRAALTRATSAQAWLVDIVSKPHAPPEYFAGPLVFNLIFSRVLAV